MHMKGLLNHSNRISLRSNSTNAVIASPGVTRICLGTKTRSSVLFKKCTGTATNFQLHFSAL